MCIRDSVSSLPGAREIVKSNRKRRIRNHWILGGISSRSFVPKSGTIAMFCPSNGLPDSRIPTLWSMPLSRSVHITVRYLIMPSIRMLLASRYPQGALGPLQLQFHMTRHLQWLNVVDDRFPEQLLKPSAPLLFRRRYLGRCPISMLCFYWEGLSEVHWSELGWVGTCPSD